MKTLDILLYPNEKLRRRSAPVEDIDDNITELIDNMTQTMYSADGVGLAAPQVGVNLRIIVVDAANRKESEPELIQIINPEIVSASGMQTGEEGCLSVPGFSANVKRYDNVTVKGLNRSATPFQVEATGLLARVLQHEIDHLEGILFFDRLSRLKRELLLKKINRTFTEP